MGMHFGIFVISLACAVALVSADGKEPIVVAPTLKCHHDHYELVGDVCINKEYVQPIAKCSHHARLHEGNCISHEHVDGSMKCPQGYELTSGKKCVSTTVVPLQFECPSHHYQPVPPTVNKGGKECVKESFHKPHTACPEGFKLSHDEVCFRQTVDKASLVCPKEYSPDRKGCFIVEKISPVFTCPKHYTLQGNGNCVREKEEEKKCPHGYVLVTSKGRDACEKTVFRDASPVCPEGAVLDDKKCWIHEKVEPHFVCKHKGATYMNGKCIRVIEEEAVIDCDHGYKLDGKHCIKKTHTHPELTCNKSETLKHSKCESIEEVPVVSCHGLECMIDKIKQADIKCPHGAKMGHNGCELIVRVDGEKICENKGELRHNKCIFYERKEPTVTCKQGEATSDGKCVIRDIVDMVGKCEKGFKLADNGKGCVKSEHAHANMVCPHNAAIKAGKCVVEVVEKAPIECPHGFTHDVKGCIKVQKQEPILVCPKDLKLVNQTCVPKHHEKEKKPKKSCSHDGPCQHDTIIIQKEEPIKHVQEPLLSFHPVTEPFNHFHETSTPIVHVGEEPIAKKEYSEPYSVYANHETHSVHAQHNTPNHDKSHMSIA